MSDVENGLAICCTSDRMIRLANIIRSKAVMATTVSVANSKPPGFPIYSLVNYLVRHTRMKRRMEHTGPAEPFCIGYVIRPL